MDEKIDQRELLRSARFQYSAITQDIKEQAIGYILEQIIGLSVDNGLTIDEIINNSKLSEASGITILHMHEAESVLSKLNKKGRVRIIKENGDKKYILSKKSSKNFISIKNKTECIAEKVVAKLFRNIDISVDRIVEPFYSFLGCIFANLTEVYVNNLIGNLEEDKITTSRCFHKELERISREYSYLDKKSFERAVRRFFSENDPDFINVKWNLSQNYYISLALGLDKAGKLLSKELFGESNIYLDTNIIIHGLEKKARHHFSFQSLISACKKSNIKVYVWKDTLEELKRVAYHYIDEIPKVAGRIPDKFKNKIKGIFYKMYIDRIEESEDDEIDFNILYNNFLNADGILSKEYYINIESDSWFNDNHDTNKTIDEVNKIQQYYEENSSRKKSKLSALHDVLLLNKIAFNYLNQKKCYLITLDTLLPSFKIDRIENQTLSITLDAFLQWLSPFARDRRTQENFSHIFSEALKYQILPQDTFFDLNDFIIFNQMDIETKELPYNDVEECILFLKKEAPSLNPNNPEDREKLYHYVSKYFADPGRKYKLELHKLETELDESKKRSADKDQSYEDELKQKDEEIMQLKETLNIANEKNERFSLIKSATNRLIIVVFLLLIMLAITTFLSIKYSTGLNIFDKIKGALPLYAIPIALTGGLFYLILGRKRIKALGWSIKKIFRVTEE